MSEKEKKDIPAEEVNTEPAAEEVKEETFTVSREQMEKMEQLAQMVAESGDKYLRLAAEYDNYRKRTAKEKESIYGSAKADTVKPFLDVYDNLLRGAAQAGESSLEAIVRELREETGIVAKPEEFELLCTDRDKICHYDFYCLHREIPLEEISLQPGETDDVKWATFEEVHQMIADKQICTVIARQFLRQEPQLLQRTKLPIL